MKDTPEFFEAFANKGTDLVRRTISGVTLGTVGKVIGHYGEYDNTTIAQLASAINKSVKSRFNHPQDPNKLGGPLEKLVGYTVRAYVDGDVARADFQIASHDAAPLGTELLNKANDANLAKFFGTSPQMDVHLEGNKIRVDDVQAVDFVEWPSANPNGLFSANREERHMAKFKVRLMDGKFFVVQEGQLFEAEADAQDGDKTERLEGEVKDGKLFCSYGGKRFEVALPKTHKLAEAEAVDADADADADAADAPGKKPAQAAARHDAQRSPKTIALEAVKTERKYRADFKTTMEAAGIAGDEAVRFEAQFCNPEMFTIPQVKFMAAALLTTRAKAVGEGGGDTNKAGAGGQDDKVVKHATELGARFEAKSALQKAYGVDGEAKTSEKFLAAKKLYVAEYLEDEKKSATPAVS